MKKVAVLLAGSGVYDGSEIHEAVFALLALDEAGAGYQCFAPDKDQFHVVNHLSRTPCSRPSLAARLSQVPRAPV